MSGGVGGVGHRVSIEAVDPSLAPRIQERLDRLTKPQGSLGRLEEIALQYCLIRRTCEPRIRKKRLFLFAADHGVTEEGVSAYPAAVTRQMVANFLRGGAAINVLAAHTGMEVTVVDVGVAGELALPGLVGRKVRPGTANLASGPAMEESETLRAIEVGVELAEEAAREGADLIAAGDMGIGNTTPSSAIVAALTGEDPEKVTGRGTGIDDAVWRRKVEVVRRALALHRPSPERPLSVAARVGGLEHAAIAGLLLGSAHHRIPFVLDGFIATAAAMIAVALEPNARGYLFAGHHSAEPGHAVALRWLGLEPLLDLGMRLGEGTGACLAAGLVEAAVRLMGEMATFETAGVAQRKTSDVAPADTVPGESS